MKKLLTSLFLALSFGVAHADYTMIVPQSVGGGTDIWARIVAKHLEKKLGEKIIIRNIPGVNDIPGFNEFHNSLRKDPKTIMVAHGGNAESYLLHNVDYDYSQYQPIGLQNLSIIVGHRNDRDVYKHINFSAGSGMNPDVMAMTLLVCGPNKTMQEYLACYKDKITYVKGMKGNERRLAYMRGELNVTRETTAAYFKHSRKVTQNVDWFSHGVLDIKTGKVVQDKNFPGISFQEVYKKKWGVAPSGEMYDAYLLVKSYRDVLQKSLWMDKGSVNAPKVIAALKSMSEDPESVSEINKDTGEYEWIIGNDVNKAMRSLSSLTNPKTLKNLVWFTSLALDQEAYYKSEIGGVKL
jgi:hypothetical protein